MDEENDEEQLIRQHPNFESIMSKMLDKKLKQLLPNYGSGKTGNETVATQNNEKASVTGNKKCNAVKSPSDTTIYAPTLNRQLQTDSIVGSQGGNNMLNPNVGLEQRISNFVGTMRKEVDDCTVTFT